LGFLRALAITDFLAINFISGEESPLIDKASKLALDL
jgi:hypothetical protein